MKQINVKLLFILAVTTLASLVGIKLLHDHQAVRGADSMLVRAKSAAEKGDYERQVKLLKGYLARRRDDDEQYTELALALKKMLEVTRTSGKTVDRQLFGETYGMIEHALRLRPENQELRESAIEFAMGFYRWPDAISHIEYLLGDSGQEYDPELAIKLAQCQFFSGQEDQAIETLSAIIGFDPIQRVFDPESAKAADHAPGYSFLASIYRRNRQRFDVARQIINRMVEVNPELPEAYVNRANFLRAGKEEDREQASRDVAQALELAPDDISTLLLAGQFALDAKEYSRAKDFYDKALVIEPENVGALKGVSLWAAATNDVDAAIDYLERAEELAPRDPSIVLQHANLELNLGNFDFVEQAIVKLRELNYPRHYRDFLEGRMHLQKREWLRAADKLNAARPHMEQDRVELLTPIDGSLALCYENLSQNDLRKEAFQRILTREPGNVLARWGKIEALRALNRTDDALADYEILERQFEVQETTSGRLLVPHLSLELLQQRNRPESRRNYAEAEALVRRVLKESGVSDSAKASVLAQYYTEIGEKEKAQAVLSKARVQDPDNVVLKLSKISKLAATDIPAARAELDKFQAEHGDMAAVRLLRAQMLMAESKGIEEMRALAENTSMFDENERLQLYARIGRLLVAAGDVGGARQLWQKVADAQPDNVQIRIGVFELALQEGDAVKRSMALKQLRELVGDDSAEMKWARAMDILWQVRRKELPVEELAEAKSLVEDAIGIRDGWEALYRIAGEIALRLDDSDRAMEAFTQAAQLGASNPEVFRNLVFLNHQKQNFAACQAYLEKLPESAWTAREQTINLELLARDGKLPEDLDINKDSNNPLDHLRIGRILGSADRLEEADAAIRRAIKLSPQSPEAWGTLFNLYIERGELDAARAVMRDAETKLSEINSATFLGRAYRLLGKWEESEAHYQAAATMQPDNLIIMNALAEMYLISNQGMKARPMLEKIIEVAEAEGKGDTGRVGWARRQLAGMIVADGTYESYVQAVELIEHNNQDALPMSSDDLLAYASMAIQRKDSFSRQKAIERMEATKLRRSFNEREQLALASLYEKEGRWTDCKSEMEALLAKSEGAEGLLDAWLNWLVKHDEIDKAATWVRKAPENSLMAIRTRAHIDVHRGQTKRAVERVLKLVPKDQTPEAVNQLKVVAAMAEELASQDESIHQLAEKLWERYATSSPRHQLEYAAYLARRNNKPVEALVACNKARKAGAVVPALQLATRVIRSQGDKLEGKYAKVVRDWSDEALAENPSNSRLYIHRSELEDALGDADASEDFLRQFMKIETASPRERGIVANNLAYRLALAGEGVESLQLAEEAMQILGPRPALKDTLGMVYLARKDYSRAITEFEELLKLSPGPTKYFHLALAQWRSEDREAATASMDQALKLGVEAAVTGSSEEQLFATLYQQMRDEAALPTAPGEDDLNESSAATRRDIPRLSAGAAG